MRKRSLAGEFTVARCIWNERAGVVSVCDPPSPGLPVQVSCKYQFSLFKLSRFLLAPSMSTCCSSARSVHQQIRLRRGGLRTRRAAVLLSASAVGSSNLFFWLFNGGPVVLFWRRYEEYHGKFVRTSNTPTPIRTGPAEPGWSHGSDPQNHPRRHVDAL